MIDRDHLLAALGGALLGLVVLGLFVAIRGTVPVPGRLPTRDRIALFARRYGGLRVAAGLGAAAFVAILTRWPVAAMAAAVLAYYWPALFGHGSTGRGAIARLEALSTWTESLKDTIAAAAGLEQAIPATVPGAAPAIQPQLARLAGRLAGREPMPSALARFARDLDDPSAEQIVAALILNAQLRGPGLRDTLTGLTRTARQELDLRRRIEARQRSIRKSSQAIIAITLGFSLGLRVFNPRFMQAYSTPTGQAWLLLVVGVFALGMLWARRIATEQLPAPFLNVARLTHEEEA